MHGVLGRGCRRTGRETNRWNVRPMSALWHTSVWLIDKRPATPKGCVTHISLGASSILIISVGYSDILRILVPPTSAFRWQKIVCNPLFLQASFSGFQAEMGCPSLHA